MADGEPGSRSRKLRLAVIMYVVLPTFSLLAGWVWIKHERLKVRDRGYVACVSAGREAAWCDSAADRNHERCMELTFRPSTRTSPESFDEQGYIECLDVGDRAYWKLSATRAAARKKAPVTP